MSDERRNPASVPRVVFEPSAPPAAPGFVISGHGLLLRSWRPESARDVRDWLRGVRDPEFRRWNTPVRPVDTPDEARTALRSRVEDAARGASASFCVTDAASGTILGHLGINNIEYAVRCARVGYWTLPEARGRGTATRALALASAWAFTDLGLHRMELGHALGHEASCRIAVRCGYLFEGRLRGAMFAEERRDVFRDVHLHARLATDPPPQPFPDA